MPVNRSWTASSLLWAPPTAQQVLVAIYQPRRRVRPMKAHLNPREGSFRSGQVRPEARVGEGRGSRRSLVARHRGGLHHAAMMRRRVRARGEVPVVSFFGGGGVGECPLALRFLVFWETRESRSRCSCPMRGIATSLACVCIRPLKSGVCLAIWGFPPCPPISTCVDGQSLVTSVVCSCQGPEMVYPAERHQDLGAKKGPSLSILSLAARLIFAN
ncbi:hypothetical protein LZ32DRAFT_44707 [Colletotrichum eremochloae]|nr:hypothetical protein LZ32DRAFT_44707 [Colletotrichum eremochloae]